MFLRRGALQAYERAVDRERLSLPRLPRITGSAFVLNMWIEREICRAEAASRRSRSN